MNPHASSKLWGLALAASLLAAAPTGADKPAEPDAEPLRAAVFRFQIEETTKDDPERLVCLEVESDGKKAPPSSTVLRGFAKDQRVRSVTACEVTPGGVFEADTRRQATLVTVGAMKRVSTSEAHVEATYYRDARRSGHYTYRVVLEDSEWQVLGPILIGILPEPR